MTTFASWEDYFFPGTKVLKNLPGIKDAAKLRDFEEGAAGYELSMMLTKNPVKGTFDRAHMKAIHQRIFRSVYSWAGQERVAPSHQQMVKHGPSPSSIAAGNYTADDNFPYDYYPANADMVEHFDRQIDRLHSLQRLDQDSPENFAEKIAEPWGEINVAHIFREGNTRTQIAFFTMFARHHGHDFDFHRFTTDSLFRAKFNAARFRIQNTVETDLFVEVLIEALRGHLEASYNPVSSQDPQNYDDYKPNLAATPDDAEYLKRNAPRR